MKNNLLMLALFSAMSGALSAQPTLQNNVFPDVGDVVTQTDADTLGIEAGQGGTNQTWNFSGLTPIPGNPVSQSTVVVASSTPFAANFPEANLSAVFSTPDGNGYAYFKKEADKITFYGSAADNLVFNYSDPEVNLVAPMDYHGTFNDTYAHVLNIPDGGSIFTKAIKAVEYDGYGTLKMPGATYSNAIRVRTAEVSIDSVLFDGGYSVSVLYTTTYDWYVANRPGPQVSISYSNGHSKTVIPGIPPFEDEIPASKSVNFVSNVTTAVKETPEQRLGLQIEGFGPNPAVETITLRFTAEKTAGELQVLVLNAAGQMLQSQVIQPDAGKNTLALPVAQLPAGQYFLTLTDGKAVKTLAWVKQ